MSDIILSHQNIAAELNNMGVLLHSCKKLDEAEDLYRDAICAVSELTDRTSNCQESGKGYKDRHLGWQEKLRQRRRLTSSYCDSTQKVADPTAQVFSCRHNDHSQYMPTFSQPLSIDLNQDQLDRIDDSEISLVLLYNMALVHVHKDSQSRAISFLEMALSLAEDKMDLQRLPIIAVACVSVYHNLGVLLYQQDRTSQSMQMLTSAIRLGKEALGDHVLVASTLNTVGNILVLRGVVTDAMGIFEEALRIHDQLAMATVMSSIDADASSKDPAAPAA